MTELNTKRQQVIDFAKKHSVVRPRDLAELSLPKDYLNQLYQEGIFLKLGRGLYQYPEQAISSHQSLVEVAKLAPKGVISLLSALSFHEIGTQNPFEVWLAIDRKGWRPTIDYPPVRYVTMSQEALHAGVEVHQVEGVDVNIFCPAKTVADCFKYRNKIGLDIAIEALKEGWKDRKFTMDQLSKYAITCRVAKVMQPYMESLG